MDDVWPRSIDKWIENGLEYQNCNRLCNNNGNPEPRKRLFPEKLIDIDHAFDLLLNQIQSFDSKPKMCGNSSPDYIDPSVDSG